MIPSGGEITLLLYKITICLTGMIPDIRKLPFLWGKTPLAWGEMTICLGKMTIFQKKNTFSLSGIIYCPLFVISDAVEKAREACRNAFAVAKMVFKHDVAARNTLQIAGPRHFHFPDSWIRRKFFIQVFWEILICRVACRNTDTIEHGCRRNRP